MARSPSSLSNCYIPLPISALLSQQTTINGNTPLLRQQPKKPTGDGDDSNQFRKVLLSQIKSGQRRSGNGTIRNTTTVTSNVSSSLSISDNKPGTESNNIPTVDMSNKSTASTTTNQTNTNKDNRRKNHSLRRIHLETNVLSTTTNCYTSSLSCSGSSLVEFGQTKVICQVLGPITASSEYLNTTSLSQSSFRIDEGILYVDVSYASYTGYPLESMAMDSTIPIDTTTTPIVSTGRLNQVSSAREHDLSNRILNSIAPCILPFLQQQQQQQELNKNNIDDDGNSISTSTNAKYAKTAIVLKFNILQDDGGILSACIAAASLALSDSSMEIYDLVSSCTVAVLFDDETDEEGAEGNGKKVLENKRIDDSRYHCLVDPTLYEMDHCDAIFTIALLPNWKGDEITCWEQTGRMALPISISNHVLTLCTDGCHTIHQLIREHLLLSSK